MKRFSDTSNQATLVENAMPRETRKQRGSRECCPFVRKPFKECHVANLTSRNAEAAIKYCGDDYWGCEVFIRRSAEMTRGKQ